jgi:hypothetical protein
MRALIWRCCELAVRLVSWISRCDEPMRIFYPFAPRRCAILLTGGNSTGNGRSCERMIPSADRLPEEYLREVGKEGVIP